MGRKISSRDDIFELMEITEGGVVRRLSGASGLPESIFQKLTKSHIWSRKCQILHREKIFRRYSRLVDDPQVPRVNTDRFFGIPPNRISLSQNINFETKKIRLLESVVQRLQHASGHRGPIFQNAAESHIWILKY